MKITMSNNPVDCLICSLDNYILKIKNKRWNSGRHTCKCHVCGKVLDSKKDKWCPEECGWMRLKDKKIYDPWICHNCLEHHDSSWVKKESGKTLPRGEVIDEVCKAIEDKFMSVAPDELYYTYEPYQIVRVVKGITDKLKDK